MDISHDEAEQALAAIQEIIKKTRRSISSRGMYLFLFVWGPIWFFGFLSSQFLHENIVGYIWTGLDILGGILSALIGIRMGKPLRKVVGPSGQRIGIFWGILFLFSAATIWVVWPVDAKIVAMIIILFVTIGWISMSLLLSISSVKFGLAMMALALIGYFLLNDYFFLWMAILGGGGMIAFGFFIRNRW